MKAGDPTQVGAQVSAWRIVLILLAVMIALPGFVIGAELSFALGASRAVPAALLGGAILAAVAALSGAAGARSRKSTYQLIADAFGTQGAKVANAVLGFSILGWYGVIAMMLGRALTGVSPLLAVTPVWLLALAGCVLTTVTTMFGFRALDLLSAITSPLKVVLLLWTFFTALRGGLTPVFAFVPAGHTNLSTGISMVAGGLIVGAVLAPDVCRFARTPWHAAAGAAMAYGLCFPAVLLLAGFPSLAVGNKDLIIIMITLGLGLPALLIVALTAWSTNTFNLYSATLVGKTVRPNAPHWKISLIAGAVGTALGLAGVSDLLVPYLLWLGICIPPIAGAYLVNVALGGPTDASRAWRVEALIAWALGSAWAALPSTWGWRITPVPALDSILVCAAVYAALRKPPARARVLPTASPPRPSDAS
ncbi:MAG TPA: cytosine permease [Steroidobacteraceae bacterium]|jgi:cytosine permease|nr:cytosine permease [Steroidobacteraceae bacterium]